MTERGFPVEEYRDRLIRAQKAMADTGLSALLLTTEPEVRYFTGFLTRFWESPTRPWFLIVPTTGDPVAVIPAIGAHLMAQSWIRDIRSWRSPGNDDDGIRLLADTLCEVAPAGGEIGVPDGPETSLRMPLADFERLKGLLPARKISGDRGIIRKLRLIKSGPEVAKIRAACGIADRAFARVPEIAQTGVPLEAVFRNFQKLCLEEGADWVSYLAGAAGQGGYQDVISPASDDPLLPGDVLMLDTGVVRDGYFCDFDRNFALPPVGGDVQAAHQKLLDATAAGFEAAKPGATASDLFRTMEKILRCGPQAGRLGHGLGMQLTEWPSLIPEDHTVLEAGMVLTLEPSVLLEGGRMLVHEENILVTDGGAEYLSDPLKDLVNLPG